MFNNKIYEKEKKNKMSLQIMAAQSFCNNSITKETEAIYSLNRTSLNQHVMLSHCERLIFWFFHPV